MKRSVTVVLLALALAATALAQAGDTRPATIEDVFLRQRIEMQILSSQARSTDQESKLMALDTVAAIYEAGDLQTEDRELFDIVQLLATEGTRHQVRSENRIINYYPVVRMRAASLLGDIGGPQAQAVLLSILREDPEPMVLAEAIYALGKIGPQGRPDEVADHIVFTLTRENARIAPDNNLALATLLSLQKLFEAGIEFEDPGKLRDTVGLIIDISTNYRYVTIVRERARDVLAMLAGRR